MTDPVYISPFADAAMTELSRALQHFELLARRPRSPRAWAFLELRLKRATETAIRACVLNRGSERYWQILDRITKAGAHRASEGP